MEASMHRFRVRPFLSSSIHKFSFNFFHFFQRISLVWNAKFHNHFYDKILSVLSSSIIIDSSCIIFFIFFVVTILFIITNTNFNCETTRINKTILCGIRDLSSSIDRGHFCSIVISSSFRWPNADLACRLTIDDWMSFKFHCSFMEFFLRPQFFGHFYQTNLSDEFCNFNKIHHSVFQIGFDLFHWIRLLFELFTQQTSWSQITRNNDMNKFDVNR